MNGRERVEAWSGKGRAGAARGAHLVRRFAGSLSPRPPSPADEAWAQRQLLPAEVLLWQCMVNADRRHSIGVARRFETATRGSGGRAATAGALLHDVGKIESGLGTFDRVLATVLGSRLSQGKYAAYHQHEHIGADLCAAAGSDPLTVALVRGEGAPADLLAALHAADDV
jgi:hypothetical protein